VFLSHSVDVQRQRQAVLSRIARQLTEHQRGSYGALLDRGDQPLHFGPLCQNQLCIEFPANEARECWIAFGVIGHVRLCQKSDHGVERWR